MAGLSIPRANRYLYDTLVGDATLTGLLPAYGADKNVFRRRIPQDATLPAVVYNFQGGTLLIVIGGTKIWSTLLYAVRAVGQGESNAALVPIANRVDALLHDVNGPIAGGGEVVECLQQSELEYDEGPETNLGGVIFQHLGAVYQLRVQP